MSCLIVFRSMTQVQYAASVLRRKQIRVSITRPPLAAGKGSCSAALQITEVDLVFVPWLIIESTRTEVSVRCSHDLFG